MLLVVVVVVVVIFLSVQPDSEFSEHVLTTPPYKKKDKMRDE